MTGVDPLMEESMTTDSDFTVFEKSVTSNASANGVHPHMPTLSLESLPPLSEEAKSIIRGVAESGVSDDGPSWDALRAILVQTLQRVLLEFWHDFPDLTLRDGESFERVVVEPLVQSLLDPRREGPPFTIQRFCELLLDPRPVYRSTKRYVYALHRLILVTTTDAPSAVPYPGMSPMSLHSESASPPAAEQQSVPDGVISAPASPSIVTDTTVMSPSAVDSITRIKKVEEEPAEITIEEEAEQLLAEQAALTAVAAAAISLDLWSPTEGGRKRKLPDELANGRVID